MSKRRSMRERQRQVIIAATVWGCCPTSGSYENAASVEDMCERLSEALRELNNDKPLPEDIMIDEAVRLGAKLARRAP